MTRVLMSQANPTGWKLEELVAVIISDIGLKNQRVSKDASTAGAEVRRLNQEIVYSLENVLIAQKHVLRELDRVGPDQGPTGKPRIGEGS